MNATTQNTKPEPTENEEFQTEECQTSMLTRKSIEGIQAMVEILIQENEPRRASVAGVEKRMAEVEMRVNEKHLELEGILSGETLNVALRAFRAEEVRKATEEGLDPGTMQYMASMVSALQQATSLLNAELLRGKGTPVKQSTAKTGRPVSRTAWWKQYLSEETNDLTCPICFKVIQEVSTTKSPNTSSFTRHIMGQHPEEYARITKP